jgi:phage shock protein C
MAELSRPNSGRVIAGVCAALARRFGWDVTIVRILVVLSIFLPGPQVLAYIIAWILIPAEGSAKAARSPQASV